MRALLVFMGVLILTPIILVGGVALYCVGVVNKEAKLRNLVVAKDKANTAQYDKMWKTMQEVAGVSNQYAEDFKEIFPALIEGRYKTGGGLMKWVQEHNPEFDTSLYKKLQVVIESEREATKQGFDQVLDLKREHDTLLDQQPSGFILALFGKDTRLEPTIVTSSATSEAFESGKDDRTLGKDGFE